MVPLNIVRSLEGARVPTFVYPRAQWQALGPLSSR